MKKIRLSFLAIVALLAMSFTFVTHEGGFAKSTKKSKQVFICQPDQGQGRFFRAYVSCLTGAQKQQGVTPCLPPGHAGFDCARALVPNLQTVTCPGGQRFCCATIATGNCPVECKPVRVFCMP